MPSPPTPKTLPPAFNLLKLCSTKDNYLLKCFPKKLQIHIMDKSSSPPWRPQPSQRFPWTTLLLISPSVDVSNLIPYQIPFNFGSHFYSYTIDEYRKIQLKLIPKCTLGSTHKDDRLRILDLTKDVMQMVAENNLCLGQTHLAYVSNKLAPRDVDLNQFTFQKPSHNTQCGSSFLSPNLFVGLPESCNDSLKLDHSKISLCL